MALGFEKQGEIRPVDTASLMALLNHSITSTERPEHKGSPLVEPEKPYTFPSHLTEYLQFEIHLKIKSRPKDL